MLGVTIGVDSPGKPWSKAARACAERMSQTTGLDCVVIDKCPPDIAHPSWLKMRVIEMFPEHDSFLVFDADILPRKRWDPAQLFEMLGRPFCAVPDRNCASTRLECQQFNFPWPDWYVNGGLLMFGKEHAPVWEYVARKHPAYGSWLEQTALNQALLKLGTEVCRLPRRFNSMHSGSSPVARGQAINTHVAGSHNPNAMYDYLSRLTSPRFKYDDLVHQGVALEAAEQPAEAESLR